MQYRIHFETKGGFWCLQFLRFSLYWVSVKEPEHTNGTTHELKVKEFENLADAEKYVLDKGIDRAYERTQHYRTDVPQYAR